MIDTLCLAVLGHEYMRADQGGHEEFGQEPLSNMTASLGGSDSRTYRSLRQVLPRLPFTCHLLLHVSGAQLALLSVFCTLVFSKPWLPTLNKRLDFLQ